SRHRSSFPTRRSSDLAHRGTLFLDEIGDMPLPMQAKLLRVLEAGEVERVGGDRCIPADVRVLTATHRNLEALVAAGQFRADLFRSEEHTSELQSPDHL